MGGPDKPSNKYDTVCKQVLPILHPRFEDNPKKKVRHAKKPNNTQYGYRERGERDRGKISYQILKETTARRVFFYFVTIRFSKLSVEASPSQIFKVYSLTLILFLPPAPGSSSSWSDILLLPRPEELGGFLSPPVPAPPLT